MSEFDNILKNKLEDFRELPSAELFDKIRKNYPKRSFLEFVKYYKYYFIAAITTILLTGTLILILDKPEKSDNIIIADNGKNSKEIIKNDISNEKIENTSQQNDVLFVKNNTNNSILIEQKVDERNSEIKYKHTNVFISHDTVVCGSQYETNVKGLTDFIIVPDDVSLSSRNGLTIFVCDKSGRYLIKYAEKTPEEILQDSMFVTFKNLSSTKVNVSKSVICPGEDLIISVKDNNTYPRWDLNEYNVSKISENTYKITGLNSGRNSVKFELFDGYCNYKFEKDIDVLQPLKHKCVSTPSICSNSDATLSIIVENIIPSEYTLNNIYSTTSGVFTDLDPGIYSLSIKYGQGCVAYDTLLIRDSMNINPYFISERDLINKNQYSFRNLTKVDDKGYEVNNNIKFIWKINGIDIIEGDNPVYEFTKDGNNTVELIAMLDGSCQSAYSETIYVSISNFRIPNIFTPNGDGIGDLFQVFYDGDIKNYNLTIMSRMGEIAFESNNIEGSWDGKINGNDEAAEGLYYYIIRGEDEFGKNIEQKGALQLVRH